MNKKVRKIELMNPKVDFVFKSLFGNEKKPEILISFLNAVFGLPKDKKIIKVQIENPNIDKEDVEDKYSILDIKATANDNTKVDVEIQIANKYDMIPRTLYYLSKIIEGQLKEKDKYNQIMKSVTINVIDFKLLTKNERVHNAFIFKEKETNEELTDLAEIHFLELEKLRDKKDINTEDLLNDWMLFIENPESEAVKMIMDKVPEIKEARNSLEALSLDRKARIKYEARQKSLKEKMSELYGAKEEGIKEGIEKKAIEMAKKMLLKKKTIEEIVEFTELSIEKVEELKKNI